MGQPGFLDAEKRLAALSKQGIQIKKGDVVLFHTGWQNMVASDLHGCSVCSQGHCSRHDGGYREEPGSSWNSPQQFLLPKNGI